MKEVLIKIMNKIVRWICFTVLFSFIPLIAMFVVSKFWGYEGGEYKYVGEILFACIVISAETLRTLAASRQHGKQALRDILFASTFLTVVFPAFLYGGMLLDYKSEVLDVLTIPTILLIASLLGGLGAQILEREAT